MSRDTLDPKTFAAALVLALWLPALVPVLTNLYLDPFRILPWHEATPVALLGGRGSDRYQHAGSISSFAPGAVVLGHSDAGNFMPTGVDRELGWQDTFNLAMDGSTLHEQSTVARHALGAGGVDHVLWLFAPHNLLAAVDATHPDMVFPSYLYNACRLDDLRLFLALPTEFYRYSRLRDRKIRALEDERARTGAAVDPRDRSTEWGRMAAGQFGRPGAIVDMYFDAAERLSRTDYQRRLASIERLDTALVGQPSAQAARIRSQIRSNLEPLIAAHPEVSFRLIVQPPYPDLYWQYLKLARPQAYRDQLFAIAALVEQLDPHDNVSLYAFGDASWTSDLRLYKDRTHYHPAVNDAMVRALAAETHRLNRSRVQDYLEDFDARITRYRIRPEWAAGGDSATTGLSDAAARAVIGDSP